MGGTNTHGKTRGLKLAKKKLPRGKMFIEAPPHVMRFVGKYSTEFTTEVGVSGLNFSLSVDEIFTLVLPSKSTTFRRIGVIPKSTRSRASEEVAALRKELHESKARERKDNVAYLKSLKKNRELECRLASMESTLSILIEMQEKWFDSLEKELGLESGYFETINGDSSHQGKVR
ncbi:hypothetical protein FNV43_RR20991 [Rhamnella rubrinervis]|uniref:Uncharacterized protein n=1 Tax=Rhamnella rubrinervis TaxID=2594499 RepID=A0A8K0DVU3_9ROSA|nr:hypothetical protein FNV43_RR20991 [Rhamnella rubrinervis]